MTNGYTVLYVTTLEYKTSKFYEYIIKIKNSIDEFYGVEFLIFMGGISDFKITKVPDSEKTKVKETYESIKNTKN